MFPVLAVQTHMTIMVMTCMPWSMITVFQIVFQNGGGNSCRPVACRLHQMLAAAISEAATAKATALAKTGMPFSGQAT